MKYRKLPVTIEAFRWTIDKAPEWWTELGGPHTNIAGGDAVISTLEGYMIARPGDWIIKGVKEEIYPCKPEIFDMTYEAVEE